jgi:plastocyanin
MSARLSLVLVSLLAITAACGGGSDSKTPDASTTDAPPATIMPVDPCPGTVAVTITTQATKFDMPAVTISQGEVVKIVSTSTHPVGPNTGTESTLAVPEGQTRCFRFTATGTFGIRCTTHGYAGTITVQ